MRQAPACPGGGDKESAPFGSSPLCPGPYPQDRGRKGRKGSKMNKKLWKVTVLAHSLAVVAPPPKPPVKPKPKPLPAPPPPPATPARENH